VQNITKTFKAKESLTRTSWETKETKPIINSNSSKLAIPDSCLPKALNETYSAQTTPKTRTIENNTWSNINKYILELCNKDLWPKLYSS
jgi:hypothetical protein